MYIAGEGEQTCRHVLPNPTMHILEDLLSKKVLVIRIKTAKAIGAPALAV